MTKRKAAVPFTDTMLRGFIKSGLPLALNDQGELVLDARGKPVRQSKVFEPGGLYVQMAANGKKLYFRFRFTMKGTAYVMALGRYPGTSLADARAKRNDAQALIDAGTNPAVKRKADAAKELADKANTFETVANEWLAVCATKWTEATHEIERARLVKHALPHIGQMPIRSITTPDVRDIVMRVVRNGRINQAHRLVVQLSRVFRYAVGHEYADSDPANALTGPDALPTARKQNFPTVTTPDQAAQVARAAWGYEGDFAIGCCLKLGLYWFCRSHELRSIEWSHVIDLDGPDPRIEIQPVNRKLRRAAKESPLTPKHVIPLSPEAVGIVRALREHTGPSRWLFPSPVKPGSHITDVSLSNAWKRMGFKGEFTQHGARHMARTLLREQGHSSEALELQLSHAKKGVESTYAKEQLLPERRKIMCAWSKYLDGLRTSSNVVPMFAKVG
jgi:integrase